MKNTIIAMTVATILLAAGFFGGTFTSQDKATPVKKTALQEVKLRIEGVENVKVSTDKSVIHKSMEIPNQEGSLSSMSFIIKDEAYTKLFSSLTVSDVSNLWNDICVLHKGTNVRKINLFINSPGGDAFSGLALAGHIERAKSYGFKVSAYASGIIASAAVPVLAVCDERVAAPGTIFMVHETSIWKWPGRETASDIRSQNELMNILRDRYLGKLAKYTKLDIEEWRELEVKTTWFSTDKAKSWGLIDKVE